jgi:protein-S-isoprenylcysteine O-methyltransferase Ste14
MGVALLHSALASRKAKALAAEVLGERNRNAFYRPFYVVQSVLSFGALMLYLGKQPNPVVWQVPPAAKPLFQAGRFAALCGMASAVRQIGWGRILGAIGLRAWAARRSEVPPEPEAQGPRLEANVPVTGPFRYSRHPLNFLGLPILWLAPKMTRNWFTFSAVATAYLIIGSWHEEQRLQAAHPKEYLNYRRQTRFFLGRRRPSLMRQIGQTGQSSARQSRRV